MTGEEAYVLAKSLVTSISAGIQSYSISPTGLLTMVTSDGQTLTYQFREPKDGVSITHVDVNSINELIIYYSDGTTETAGTIATVKGDKGEDGYSPQITVNTETESVYRLNITYLDEVTGNVETIVTPNLKGAGSGGDEPLTPEQLAELINLI